MRKLRKRVKQLEAEVAKLRYLYLDVSGDLNMHLDGFVYDPATETWRQPTIIGNTSSGLGGAVITVHGPPYGHFGMH